MVGRGVRSTREGVLAADGGLDPTAYVAPPPTAATSGPGGASQATFEDLTYPERLDAETLPPETLEEPTAPDAEQPAPVAPVEARTAPRPDIDTRTAAPPVETVSRRSESDGEAFVVQVAAVHGRPAADRMAQRLVDKGYDAYVAEPSTRAPTLFRVRVGRFTDRREAETVAARLEKEEQFKPWITR